MSQPGALSGQCKQLYNTLSTLYKAEITLTRLTLPPQGDALDVEVLSGISTSTDKKMSKVAVIDTEKKTFRTLSSCCSAPFTETG